MPSYTSVFGGTTIYPSDVSYRALSITTDLVLQWPFESTNSLNTVAAIMDVTATAGLSLFMPDASSGSTGQAVLFNNVGSNTFTVKTATGVVICTVPSGQAWQVYPYDNTTVSGLWRAFQYGAGTSSGSAAALAGPGLSAVGAQLGQDVDVQTKSSTYTIGSTDLATAIVWTGGSGTINLSLAATLGASFFCHVKNAGAGTLSLTPSGSNTIDGVNAAVSMAPNDSFIIICDGTSFYTIGKGLAPSATITYLSVALTGGGLAGNTTLNATQYSKSILRFTGALTGNSQVSFPAIVSEWIIDNATTGAFTLTMQVVGAPGATYAVPQGTRALIYSDGTNIYSTNTAAIVTPISIPNGGTGATTASAARTNLGSTAVGDALFIATSATSARTALGVGATGDSIFTASTVAAVYSVIGSGRSISTSGYLTGGGNLTADRTLSLGSMGAASRLLGSGSGGATIGDITLGTNLSMSGNTLNATSNVGTVTSVATSGGITGGTITGSGTVSLDTNPAQGVGQMALLVNNSGSSISNNATVTASGSNMPFCKFNTSNVITSTGNFPANGQVWRNITGGSLSNGESGLFIRVS